MLNAYLYMHLGIGRGAWCMHTLECMRCVANILISSYILTNNVTTHMLQMHTRKCVCIYSMCVQLCCTQAKKIKI